MIVNYSQLPLYIEKTQLMSFPPSSPILDLLLAFLDVAVTSCQPV